MATCPLVSSQWASPAAEEGGEEGTGEVLVLPSKRGFTPLLPQRPQRGFSWLMVLFLVGGDVIPWGCSLLGMAQGWVWPGERCIDGPGAWAAPAGAGLPRHASSPSRVTLADRKEWMMKTMVLGQE